MSSQGVMSCKQANNSPKRSPTTCGVSEYDREASKVKAMTRRWAEAPEERKQN